jgi:hypothetical protein
LGLNRTCFPKPLSSFFLFFFFHFFFFFVQRARGNWQLGRTRWRSCASLAAPTRSSFSPPAPCMLPRKHPSDPPALSVLLSFIPSFFRENWHNYIFCFGLMKQALLRQISKWTDAHGLACLLLQRPRALESRCVGGSVYCPNPPLPKTFTRNELVAQHKAANASMFDEGV